jgi:hypothetical protein
MYYKRIVVELVVGADEADAVVNQLNGALDHIEEKHVIFGGDIETAAFNHSGMKRRSALRHTLAAGEAVAVALRNTRKRVDDALRAVI